MVDDGMDAPGFDQLAHTIDRKCDVRISRYARVIEGITAVGIDQLGDGEITRDRSEARVPPAKRRIEGRLIRRDEARARDQSESAFRKRFFEWRPGHGVDLPPRIRAQKNSIDERELSELTHPSGLCARPAERAGRRDPGRSYGRWNP